jgi:hypothetical protein
VNRPFGGAAAGHGQTPSSATKAVQQPGPHNLIGATLRAQNLPTRRGPRRPNQLGPHNLIGVTLRAQNQRDPRCPLCRKARKAYGAYQAAFTVPFLLDTLGNAFGLFDSWSSFDNVLHFVNWFVLVWGMSKALDRTRRHDRGLLWIAGTGIGALAAEYSIMQAGVGDLHLTYADTLGDLAAGSTGGALGALVAVKFGNAHHQLLARSS